MENTFGNLNPVLFLLAGSQDVSVTLQNYSKAVADLIASLAMPLLDLPALRDQYTLAILPGHHRYALILF